MDLTAFLTFAGVLTTGIVGASTAWITATNKAKGEKFALARAQLETANTTKEVELEKAQIAVEQARSEAFWAALQAELDKERVARGMLETRITALSDDLARERDQRVKLVFELDRARQIIEELQTTIQTLQERLSAYERDHSQAAEQAA